MSIEFMYINPAIILLQGQYSANTAQAEGVNWSQTFGMLGQFFFLLIIFCGVMAGAYYVSKLLGTVQYARNRNHTMKIIESISLAPQKTIQLIKIGDKALVIGVTKDHICFLTDLSLDSIPITDEADGNKNILSFEEHLKKWMHQVKNKKE
jgi:flagellar protein FliO/FliZ